MKNKGLIFLILGLGISSGTQLINHFIVPVHEWAAVLLMILAAVFLIMAVYNVVIKK